MQALAAKRQYSEVLKAASHRRASDALDDQLDSALSRFLFRFWEVAKSH
jgi:hypothetical protein